MFDGLYRFKAMTGLLLLTALLVGCSDSSNRNLSLIHI